MSNSMRWRYGDTNPVMMAVDSATVVEIGDLVFLDADDAKPASAQTDAGSETLNQEEFHTNFAGVAMQASADGDTAAIRVATSGVFEFSCAATTLEIGDLIGAVEASGGTSLEDQSVAPVAAVTSAIGRCAKRVNPAGTRALVDIVSTVMKGGVQAAA